MFKNNISKTMNYSGNIFTINFKQKLKKEMKKYIADKKSIGILLSGGLDSRIVAGLLKELQNERYFNGSITALTWGIDQSNDVIYAKEIAKRFHWDIIHKELNSNVLRENIKIAGKYGAEFSPLHYHAMKSISEVKGLDVVLAGSYGDSVGKGKFSGVNVENLQPIIPRKLNPYGLIKEKAISKSIDIIREDAYSYRKYIHRNNSYQYREVHGYQCKKE